MPAESTHSFVDGLDYLAKYWGYIVLLGPTLIFFLAVSALRPIKKTPAWQDELSTSASLLISLLVVYLIYVIGVFVENFHTKGIQSDFEEWGQVGDYFGGMLNPILAFASFIALLYTIRIQSEELKLTREEFEKSSRAQQEIADTAKDELALAKAGQQAQRELQFAMPFFDICQQRIKNCEEILGRLATVKNDTYDDKMKWKDFIIYFAKKESPLTYGHQAGASLLTGSRNKEFIDESLNVLQAIKSEFQDAWNAIESVDSIIESVESQKMKHRMIGLVVNRLAWIAYILHITDVKHFSNEVQDYWHNQNDFLVDEFRAHLKRIYDTA